MRRAHAGQRRGAARGVARLVPRLIIGGALLMLVVALALFAFRAVYSGRVYPAVVVGDVPVGGLTIAQAENRLVARADELEQGVVTFTHGEQRWTPTLSQFGATVDVDRSLAIAHARGREGDAVARLSFAGSILRQDQTVPLHTNVDSRALDAWFDQVDADLGQPAVNAALVVKGLDVSVSPDKDGLVVDRDAARADVLQALTALEPVTIELPTRAQAPEIRVDDLAQARQDVRQVMAEHVTVEFEGTEWTLNRQELASFLTVDTRAVDGEPDVVLTMDEKRLATLLREKFATKINRKPVDAEVRWDSDSNGLFAKVPSIDGISLKASSFAAVVSESFLGDHDNVDIPVVVTKPAVDDDNLEALKVQTRIGQGDSNYEGGSAERDKNIGVGVGLLNGTLVKPGEKFSFNGAIGAIDKQKGYVEASVVENGRVGTDIGGGICQVSTTVFRAALRSGLPIDTWNPHTYRIKTYERDGWSAGYDASVLQLGDPSVWGDFKFENVTDGWLYVESWTEYPRVIVNIYGPKLGWKVEFSDTKVSGPIKEDKDIEHVDPERPQGFMQQTEYPMDGYEASFVRTVTDKEGKELWERNFYTRFKGRGNVWTVSPDMKGKSPAAKSGDG